AVGRLVQRQRVLRGRSLVEPYRQYHEDADRALDPDGLEGSEKPEPEGCTPRVVGRDLVSYDLVVLRLGLSRPEDLDRALERQGVVDHREPEQSPLRRAAFRRVMHQREILLRD